MFQLSGVLCVSVIMCVLCFSYQVACALVTGFQCVCCAQYFFRNAALGASELFIIIIAVFSGGCDICGVLCGMHILVIALETCGVY